MAIPKPAGNSPERADRSQEPFISQRSDNDRSPRYCVQIRRKQDQGYVSASKTFTTLEAAMKWRDDTLAKIQLGLLVPKQKEEETKQVLVCDLLQRRRESGRRLGRSANQNLDLLIKHDRCQVPASTIDLNWFISMADDLIDTGMLPQTAASYMAMLAASLKWAADREADVAEEYSDTLKDITSLKQEMRLASDQLNRTVITAPMRGIVNNLAVTTIGGVVRPGEEIFEIIPLGEDLFVEARVRPENIANVEPGQDASIKLTAYDYTIYGTLKGKVDFISADTFEDERDPSAPPFYRVTVTVDVDKLTDRQKAIEIRPGMRASVELHTGSKTVLRYLMKPLYKSREAFREP
ncbi:MAG: HlyD family efflux transporter periplasmic adaptor subunit [Shimia sp.]|nr:HlyD family efflux transporter periplasmic adaptor subunit [Shimia sp.]